MKFETLSVQGFIDLKKQNNAISTPIYANTAYSFDSVEHAVDLFDLKVAGDIYSRLSNPSCDMIEKRIAALEGGVGALATSSGQSAVLITMLNFAGAGDEIITSDKIYGGTYNLFAKTFKPLFFVNVYKLGKLFSHKYLSLFSHLLNFSIIASTIRSLA